MLAEYGSGLYKFLLVCHILAAIVGIGAVMLNGLYAAQAQKREGPAGRRGQLRVGQSGRRPSLDQDARSAKDQEGHRRLTAALPPKSP